METYHTIHCKNGDCRSGDHELIREEPLLIRVDGKPYSVVMRLPGEEIPHAAGFCLGEGLVDGFNDFATIGFCEDIDPNVVEVRLKPERREKIPEILERRGFVSQTSCGICGKEMIEDLFQILTPVKQKIKIGIDDVFSCSEKLEDTQVYYSKTRGSHAAMIFDSSLNALSFAEDVGRHNALDKAIGKLVLSGGMKNAVMVVLSSRLSYELVQKAARAKIPIMISKSRPTALAVEIGKTQQMTLACNPKGAELIIFSGEQRILRN